MLFIVSEMKTKTRIFLGISISIFGAIACFSFLEFYSEYILKARDSEAKTNLSSYAMAQDAFFKEYQRYSKDTESIGYSQEGNLRGRLYISRESLPAEVVRLISLDQEPFVDQNAFRVLYVMGSGSEIRVFSIDQNKVVSRLK